MNNVWLNEFRSRLKGFEFKNPPSNCLSVSFKIRVSSGCFHREHSPEAYKVIDNYVSTIKQSYIFSFEEHESGPEIIAYVTLGTAGITLAASLINLITAIIRARSEGIKKGDRPSEPIELIVRFIDLNAKYIEERVLRINNTDIINSKKVKEALYKALTNYKTPKNNVRRITKGLASRAKKSK